jgi:hypothetical protein
MVKRGDVARVVKKVGAHETHFQFRQVREELKVEADQKNEANRTWNILAEFIAEGIVEEIPGGSRKRHKYYRVKNQAKLLELLAAQPLNGTPRPAGAAPDRPGRIEGEIRAIRESQETFQETVLERLAMLDAKVSQLVQAWS